MKESRFSEQQIVEILKEAEVGVAVKELCRKHGISDAPFYSSPPSLSPGASAAALSFANIQPGKTHQNAFIERFNRSYHDEVLNAYVFCDLDEVRQITREWLRSYNEERPHDALGSLPPALYREQLTAKNSTTELAI